MNSAPVPFFPDGLARFDRLLAGRLLCAFDFDGTLAPIVNDPAQARMPPQVAKRMIDLVRLTPVAVITGRSVADMRRRLGFALDYVVGNHGLEGFPDNDEMQAANRQRCLAWERDLGMALAREGQADPGIRIENKIYTLSVHYRLARNPALAEATLAGQIARWCPDARLMRGKYVFNLLPPGAADKGMALVRLMQASGATHALYIGDDVTDEDVFRLRRPDVLTIRIGDGGPTLADTFLARQEDIGALLDALIASLRKKTRSSGRYDVR